MPIPKRWASSAVALLLAPDVSAQVAPPSSPPPDARSRAADQGSAAMDRLRTATAARKADAAALPALPPVLDAAARQRAADAMSHRLASPAMDARARAAATAGHERLAAAREAMAKRLGQALGLDAPDRAAVAGAAAPATNAWVPVLFVSASMPIEVLRTYAGQLERVGGVLAFRGMPGGMTRIGPMAKLSAAILRRDAGCDGPACAMRGVQVIIDPLVFRQHGIARVPALAMIPGDPTQPYCEREEGSPAATHVVYGDAALSGLLDEYARLGGSKEVRDARRRLESR